MNPAGFDVTTKLGDAQFTMKNGERIPIHGATNLEGAFNIIGYTPNNGTLTPPLARKPALTNPDGNPLPTGLSEDGYPVNVGSSFMMVLEFTEQGPRAQAVLSYSQSADPASPHFADQTRLFSESKYRPVLFTETEILADPQLETIELEVP